MMGKEIFVKKSGQAVFRIEVEELNWDPHNV